MRLRLRSNAKLTVGFVLTLGLLLMAGLSLVWTPWPTQELDVLAKLQPPGEAHWLGTDSLGRDVASLLMAGARVSIRVGLIAVAIGMGIGVTLGLWAASSTASHSGRRWIDELLMRAADLGFAFPAILTALLFTAVFGPGIEVAIAAIGLHAVPTFARVTRASAREVWTRGYCLAARACGRGSWDITLHHVLPNIAPVLIVQATIQFALAILAEAALSYLGLGTQAPQASWGRMLAEAQSFLFSAPLLAVFPGLALMAAVLGLNLLGDGLRDLSDPKLAKACSMSAAPPLLEVSNLRIRLRGTELVRGISFTLAAGETLGLIGESGSGKTLTALALMGLLPDGATVSGSIRFKGQELVGLDEKSWCQLRGRRIAMVFQEPMTALNPLHRVGEQVAEPRRLHLGRKRAEAAAEAQQLLQYVGLADAPRMAAAYPHQLSGGQRQRAGIAMALACGPELLIADEPSTALDASQQGHVLASLAVMARERSMALLLISHDLALVARQAQRLLVMYAGQVVEQGPAAALFGRGPAVAAHPYTQGLLAARPQLGIGRGERLNALPGTAPDLAALPLKGAGCAFRERCRLAADICRQDPTPVPVADGHWTRCLRSEEALRG